GSHVLGRSVPAHRRGREEARGRPLVVEAEALGHIVSRRIGLDEAGRHRVHGDAERAELEREPAHETLRGCLGRAQDAVAGHGLEAVDPGDQHDAAGPSLHERDRSLGHRHEGVDRDREGAPDIVRPLLQHRAERGGRRVRHQHVHAAERGRDPLEDRRDLLRLRQLELLRDRAHPQRLERGHCLARGGGVLTVRYGAVGAVAREAEGNAPTDPARAAGDDGHSPLERSGHARAQSRCRIASASSTIAAITSATGRTSWMSPADWPAAALPFSTSPSSRARIAAGLPTRSYWTGKGWISAWRLSHSRVKAFRIWRLGLPDTARVTTVPSSSMAAILRL